MTISKNSKKEIKEMGLEKIQLQLQDAEHRACIVGGWDEICREYIGVALGTLRFMLSLGVIDSNEYERMSKEFGNDNQKRLFKLEHGYC